MFVKIYTLVSRLSGIRVILVKLSYFSWYSSRNWLWKTEIEETISRNISPVRAQYSAIPRAEYKIILLSIKNITVLHHKAQILLHLTVQRSPNLQTAASKLRRARHSSGGSTLSPRLTSSVQSMFPTPGSGMIFLTMQRRHLRWVRLSETNRRIEIMSW